MVYKNPILSILLLVLIAHACNTAESLTASHPGPSDPKATVRARALFENLDRIRTEQVLFGHQDALAYGVRWVGQPGRSDVLEVAGSFPAVYGWELGGLERGGWNNFDGIPFAHMQQFIREGYQRGGVITISWHMDNPVTGGDAWDVQLEHGVVASILPDGAHHATFIANLEKVAQFIRGLQMTDDNGNTYLIPVVFRPWHEMNGNWFWWGTAFNTDEEISALFRFTVDYMRDVQGLHNLLWAYAPNSLSELEEREAYWRWYPGDAWVDVLGFDDYYTTWGGYGHPDGVATMTEHLVWLVEQSEALGKIPALTETGQLDMLTDNDWYTAQLLAAILGHPTAKRIAWVMVWRNANAETNRKDHFYVPYPGHPAAPDFLYFTQHPIIWMEDDLPDLYRIFGKIK